MPTLKQKRAIKLLATENVSIKQAMRQAGYSETVHTNQLTRSKAYQETIDKYLKEDKLLKLVEQGTRARDNKKPDWGNRHKFIETALRLKGFNAEQQGSGANITIINPLAVNVDAKGNKELE